MSTPRDSDSLAWLAVGGEMGERIRSFDWAATPLGPIDRWSPALRMMTRFLLANRFPLLLWWGPEYVSIYNDAYRPVLGAKHPWALGKPVAECWAEIWNVLRPLIDTPFRGGPATWNDDILLEINRHGFVEETHFTIAYSPVPDETVASGIGGVLATVHEITEKIVAERRGEVLRDLAARTGEAITADHACAIAAETLARHAKDVPFAMFYLFDRDGDCARLAGSVGVDAARTACPHTVSLGDDGASDPVWPFSAVARERTAITVGDLGARLVEVPRGPWSEPPSKAVLVPIRSNKADELAGVMIAGVSARLQLDSGYRSFLELAAAQVATAVATARAYEEERRRAEALAEIDRVKTQFFSNISHELRTPLTLMLSPVEDLLDTDDTLAPASRQQLQMVHRNARRLQKLVNTILDFARIEDGRTRAHYEETDLATYTAELASNFSSACERAGLSLAIHCPPPPNNTPPAYVDRGMWEKIVLNLMSNAFKYTLEGGIDVSLVTEDDSATLTVRDTGLGIAADELPRVFERFYRAKHARGRTHEGSGIGLSLVRELVKQHDGRIHAESELGKGSVFTVSIPLGRSHLDAERIANAGSVQTATASTPVHGDEVMNWRHEAGIEREDEAGLNGLPPAAAQGDTPGSRYARPRIIWADDNADMRGYVQRLLAPRFDVLAVSDGAEALELARSMVREGRRPDLVLTDVMMPRLDGVGLLRELRADPALRSVPIIVLSARAGEEARIDGIEAGADDYVIKPFSARELVAKVEAQVRLAHYRREADRALRESEAQLRIALEVGGFGNWQLGLPEMTLHASKECKAHFGRDADAPFTFEIFCASLHPDDRQMVLDKLTRAAAAAGECEADYRAVWPDGSVRWINGKGRTIAGEDGRAARMVGVTADITAHKRRELNQSVLAQIADDMSRLVAADEIIHAVGARLAEHLGLSGCAFADVDDAENAVTVHQGWSSKEVPGVKSRTFLLADYLTEEFIRANRAGETVVVNDTGNDARTDAAAYARLEIGAFITVPFQRSGRWAAYFAVTAPKARIWKADEIELLRDVSERVFPRIERARAEAAVRESEAQLRHAMAAANAGSWAVDLATGAFSASERARALQGLPPNTPMNHASALSSVHPDDRAGVEAALSRTAQTGEPFRTEHRILQPDGSMRWVASQAERREGYGPSSLIGLVRDITQRKQAETELAGSEQRLRAFLESSAVIAWLKDEKGRHVFLSRNYEQHFGVSLDDWRGKTDFEVWPHEIAEQFRRNDEAVLAEDKPVEVVEHTVDRAGKTSWWLNHKFTFRGADGRRYIGGLGVDITAQRFAEAERRHLAAVVASSSEAIVSKTLDGIVTSWNGAAERIFGFTAEEMIGTSIRRIVPPDRQAEEDDILARIRRGERLQNYETVRISKEGRPVDVSVTISPIIDEDGTIIGASKIAHDIGDRKRAEERERLMMIEVNHRSKNMLSVVQAIARQTASANPTDFVARFSERLQSLAVSQDLLVKHAWKAVPIDELVRSQLSHFADLIGTRITISGPKLAATPSAAQAMGMALHELATNAVKYGALSNDAGTISIEWAIAGEDGQDRQLRMSWIERGGPPVRTPTVRGFGSNVISGMVRMSVGGDVRLDYASSGLEWRLTCPLANVASDPSRPEERSADAAEVERSFESRQTPH